MPSTSTSCSNGSEWPHRHDVLVAIHLDSSGQQREERRTHVYHALIHDQNVHRLNKRTRLSSSRVVSASDCGARRPSSHSLGEGLNLAAWPRFGGMFPLTPTWNHHCLLPRDVLLARHELWPCVCLSVRLSVCLSQVGVLSKWMDVSR